MDEGGTLQEGVSEVPLGTSRLTTGYAGQHILVLALPTTAAILSGFRGLVKVLRTPPWPTNPGQHNPVSVPFSFPQADEPELISLQVWRTGAHGACDCNSMAANCRSVRAAQRTTKSSGPRSGCAATLCSVQTLVNTHATSRSARGLFAAIMSSVRAAPDGDRRPCSHS